jgi:murein DD-endopeptidase MepM/ murein hydrolase activator NlpD
VLAALAMFLLSCVCVSLLLGAAFSVGNTYNIPIISSVLRHIENKTQDHMKDYTQRNLRFLAQEVGTMKADLYQVQQIGQRVSKMLSIPINTENTISVNKECIANVSNTPSNPSMPHIGGPLITDQASDALSFEHLTLDIKQFRSTILEQRDFFDTSEAIMTYQKEGVSNFLKLENPVKNVSMSSLFGWRIDPFTGQKALHNGVDFTAAEGTEILAAADGVVSHVESHPAYGLVVELDHGQNIMTRYAHTSKILVKPGDLIKKGQLIALIGSTGRSTGAHLHFEVLRNGAAENPIPFLHQHYISKR